MKRWLRTAVAGSLLFGGVSLAAVIAGSPAASATSTPSLYVVMGDAGTTCSNASPCGSIQTAITRAETHTYNGDDVTINVGAGTYTENDTINASSLNELVIAGTGASTATVDGNQAGTVFTVAAGDVTFSGLAITNGLATNGGGIANDGGGTVNITSSTVSGNSTGAANTGGDGVTGPGSPYGNGGGGIYNDDGTVNITSSTVSGNSTGVGSDGGYGYNGNFGGNGGNGGGILNITGTVNITSSTISGNSTGAGGSGYYYGGSGGNGGGIDNAGDGVVDITSSTVSGNGTGDGGYGYGMGGNGGNGGGVDNAGTVNVSSSTVEGNSVGAAGPGNYGGGYGGDGGGIDNAGTAANLAATIVAENPTGGDCSGTITDEGYNISDDASCGFSANGSTNSSATLDSTLGPLQNNGGPTDTIALLTGSPAIEVVNDQSLCPATDQRGFTRPFPCSIGAFEPGDATVSGVTFYGSLSDPLIEVTGTDLGTEPTPQAAGCSAGGSDFGTAIILSDDTQTWGAGYGNDCIGLYVSQWSDTEILFSLGDWYYDQELPSSTGLNPSDNYTVTVDGYASASGSVSYTTLPGSQSTYSCTSSGLPSADIDLDVSDLSTPPGSMSVGATYSTSYQLVATIPSTYIEEAQSDGVEDIAINGVQPTVDASSSNGGAMNPASVTTQTTNTPIALPIGTNGPGDVIVAGTTDSVTWTASSAGTVSFVPSTLELNTTSVTTGGDVQGDYSCAPTTTPGAIDSTTVSAPSPTPSFSVSALVAQNEVTAGDDAGWNVTVSNTSTVAVTGLAADISATDGGPALSFDLAGMTDGGTDCASNGAGSGSVACPIGTLAADTSVTLYVLVETSGLGNGTTITGSASSTSSDAGSGSASLGAIDVVVPENGSIALAVAAPAVAVSNTTASASSAAFPVKATLKLPKYKIKSSNAALIEVREGKHHRLVVRAAAAATLTVSTPAPVQIQAYNAAQAPQLCGTAGTSCYGSLVDIEITGNTADYSSALHPATAVIEVYVGAQNTAGLVMWVQEANGQAFQLQRCTKSTSGYDVPCLTKAQSTLGGKGKKSLKDSVDFIAGPTDPVFGIR